MNSFCQVLHVALLVALNVKASCFQPRPAVPVAAAGVGPGRQRAIGAFPLRVGTGMAFDDGDQILVSAQKPLGIVLEEADEGVGRDGGGGGRCPAGRPSGGDPECGRDCRPHQRSPRAHRKRPEGGQSTVPKGRLI